MRRSIICLAVLAFISVIAIQIIFGQEANTRITTSDQAEQKARRSFASLIGSLMVV